MRFSYVVSVLFLIVAGCGESGVQDPSTSGASTVPSSTSLLAPSTTTTAIVPTTTETGAPTTTMMVSGRATLADLGLVPGEPIEEPTGFDWLPDPQSLMALADHPRARISSRIEISDEPAQVSDSEIEQVSLITITYYDGYSIWDYPGGYREARREGGDYMYLDSDGTWKVSDRFEWPPFGPLPEWTIADEYAWGLIEQGGHTVEGFEVLAGVETAHLRWAGASAERWADIWVDSSGTVIRLILDMARDDEDPLNQVWMVWDVLTFDPQDIGPLPPG